MSGMELLLRAATLRNGADARAIPSGADFVADTDAPLRSAESSRSTSKMSLPPKKRRKLQYRTAVSCPGSSGSGAAMATSAQSKGGVVTTDFTSLRSESIPYTASERLRPINRTLKRYSKDTTTTSNTTRRGSSSNKKFRHSRGPRRQHSNDLNSEMTDVDGNDVCMGYFSLPRRKASSLVVPETKAPSIEAQETQKHAPASTEHKFLRYLATGMSCPAVTLQEEKHTSPQATATELLSCQAYLQMHYLALTDQQTLPRREIACNYKPRDSNG